MASNTLPVSQMAHEQSFHSAVENNEGAEGVLQESKHSETLEEEFKSDEIVGEGKEDSASSRSHLGKEEGGDDTIDLDLNIEAGSEDLDAIIPLYFGCEPSLDSFNPVNIFAPTAVSEKNGAPIMPLYIECESSRHENIMSDSNQRENLTGIDLNMTIDPLLVKELHVPYCTSSVERAEKTQPGLNWFKEEEEAPPLLQLSSSMQPSMRIFDLNDDPFVFYSDPVLTNLDSGMFIDKMDELSARAFITGMEYNTPSCSNWVPDLNMNSGMMQIENGGNEEGSLMHLFMPESRNLLGGERKAMKRKEPDSGLEPYGFDYDHLRLRL